MFAASLWSRNVITWTRKLFHDLQLKFGFVMFTAEDSAASYASCIASWQRQPTKRTREAVHVKNQVSRAHHQVRRSDPSSTAGASSNWKYSEEENEDRQFTVISNVLGSRNRKRNQEMSPATIMSHLQTHELTFSAFAISPKSNYFPFASHRLFICT